MKIAFFMETPFNLGGEQRVTSIVSNILIEQGNDVSIICTNSKIKEDYDIYKLNNKVKIFFIKDEIKTVKYKILSFYGKVLSRINRKSNLFKNNVKLLEHIYYNRDRYALEELTRTINIERFDYVVGVSGRHSMLLTFVKNSISAKIIGWQHSCYNAYFNTNGKYYWHEKKLFEKRIPMLNEYIVLTQQDKEIIDKNLLIKSTVIHNPKSFISDATSNLTKKNFLAAGRFNYVKGYDLLIEAFSIFAQKNEDWTLTIVGQGEEKDKIIKLVKEFNLEDRVKIDGFTNDIKKYMMNSSIYLLTSRWEGMPMVVLEAYEMGLPIISFDIDAMKELTNSTETRSYSREI